MEAKADGQKSAGTPRARKTKASTAVQFFLRGLAITLPPVLTLVILIWIGQGIYGYVINPINNLVRATIAQFIDNSQPTEEFHVLPGRPALKYCGQDYVVTFDERKKLEAELARRKKDPSRANLLMPEEISLDNVFVPVGDDTRAVPYVQYELVARNVPEGQMPRTVTGIYMEVATHSYFFGVFHISAMAVILTVVILYFIGRFVTARLGAWFVYKFETVILARLPLISTIYSSVKQVTDFVFSERTVEYNRVVALEYPRHGIWSIGFVTGDSMLEMTAAAGEPLVTILVPTSPMPITGYTMSVPKSAVIDLDITIDQAFQFCVSCGVLVPKQQKVTPELLQQEIAKRLAGSEPALPPSQRIPGEVKQRIENRADESEPNSTETSS